MFQYEIAFLSIIRLRRILRRFASMASVWIYWALFVFFIFFLTIHDSYIDIFIRISSIAFLPVIYTASQAWYDASRRVGRRPYDLRGEATRCYAPWLASPAEATDEFVI